MSLAPAYGPQQPHRAAGSPVSKAVLDRIGATLVLLPCVPWLLLIAALLWLQDDRPVLVRETRVGQWGRRFDLLRFRTDDRRVGTVLRRSGLDELPQLINVMKGDMSFIGPRPAASVEGRVVDPHLWLALKPGLTGPWLSSRPPSTRESASVELDRYLRNWSPTRDLTILWHSLRDALGRLTHGESR
jgi:lipopolysaccharide/colanic/teichoic acid biosynthesis glycosyltransferase